MKFIKTFKMAIIAFRNIILGGNLISFSLLHNPKQMIRYISESLFLYKTFNAKRGIPQKNVFHVLPSKNIESINLGNLHGGTWFFSLSSFAVDIVNLCMIVQITKPKTVFEIGTLKGYTTFHLALNAPHDSKIFTLDLPKDGKTVPKLKTTEVDDSNINSHRESEEYYFQNSDAASKITCLFGDSATFDFTPFHGKVDFFYIDGAHSYEYVRSDTLNALKCSHPGSVIAWHDFGRVGVNGVSKWILELSKKHEIYSVPGGSIAFMQLK